MSQGWIVCQGLAKYQGRDVFSADTTNEPDGSASAFVVVVTKSFAQSLFIMNR
jgi:hypothetical protein